MKEECRSSEEGYKKEMEKLKEKVQGTEVLDIKLEEKKVLEEKVDKLEAKIAKARTILRDSGAHYVIDTINDLPGVIEKINERLAMGISP